MGPTQIHEDFTYTMAGLVMKYVKTTYPPQPNGMRWEWRYRYNWQGAREQKRQYAYPGDSMQGSIHPWIYYLRGASGEELAVYHGRQYTTTSDSCAPPGPGIIFYPNEYLTNGGELTTIPDTANPQGRKEFSIKDHLSSVRCIVGIKDSTLNVRSFDYKPFGDSLSNEQERLGFMDNEYDFESRYFPLGARMYDARIGRFLSIDPLFEKFRMQSPYNYAFNSPLTKSDPSGLAPKGEKNKDKLLSFEIDMCALMQAINNLATQGASEDESYRNQLYNEMMNNHNFLVACMRLGFDGALALERAANGFGGGYITITGTKIERDAFKQALENMTGATVNMDENGVITGIQRKDKDSKYDEPYTRLEKMMTSGVSINMMFATTEELKTFGNGNINGAFFQDGFEDSYFPTVVLNSDQWLGTADKPTYEHFESNFWHYGWSRPDETLERVLAHEFLGHAYDYSQNPWGYNDVWDKEEIEIDAVNIENIVGAIMGKPWRSCYWCTHGVDPRITPP